MTKRLSILLFLSLFLVACNSINVRRRAEILDDSIDQYNVAMRWAFYNEAEAFHMSRDGVRSKIDSDALEDIRITGYSIAEKNINEELTEATVRGEISYYNTGQGTLKKTKFDHKWWYDPEQKRWFNESEPPMFQ